MIEGLLLEVVCKYEVKQTKIHDFMQVLQMLGFFWTTLYMKAVKMLLGVRQSTNNDACLVEAGYPTLEAQVRHRQRRFLENMTEQRRNMDDDPLMFALKLTERDNPHMNRYIQALRREPDNIVEVNLSSIKSRIMSSSKTKVITYRTFNPDLTIHPMYQGETVVDDDLRTALTRLRLSSH